MKQSNLYVLLSVFLILSFAVGCSSDVKKLKVSPSKLNFERVNIDYFLEIEVTLTNKYSEKISIQSMVINNSSDFTISNSNTTSFDLEKNDIHKFTVKFEPSSAGEIKAQLVISHTGSTNPKEITMIGIGVPVAIVDFSDKIYDFNKKLINQTYTHDVTIENKGTDNLSVTSLTFSGTNASSFSISSGDAPFEIQPNHNHTFTIQFSPTTVGNYAADLTIEHNAVNESLQFIYPLSGIGTNVNPQITLDISSTWDFGSIPTTMSTSLPCEISNTGTDSLTVTSGVLSNSLEFKVVSLRDSSYNIINFPQILTPGTKIYLWIKFSPTTKTTFNDTLTFDHDGINVNSPLVISLTGIGRDETTKTYNFTGSAQQFIVPANISMVKIEAYGAAGGNGYPYSSSVNGGKGGLTTALFTVTPGITMNIYVGGKGGDGSATTPGPGGWNGGGVGSYYSSSYCGAGGGGASDVRIGGIDFSNRVIVAGAGGGSGNAGMGGEYGGGGGGLTGGNGNISGSFSSADCGSGGTQNAGGAAASGGGSPGSLGMGGAATNSSSWPGGGGGAGYFGGGGALLGGGGGGSSFTNLGANAVSHQQGIKSDDGEIKIIY